MIINSKVYNDFALLCIVLLPSLFSVLFNGSFTIGALISCVVILMTSLLKKSQTIISTNSVIVCSILITLIISNALITDALEANFNLDKFFVSIPMLFLMFFAAIIFSCNLDNNKNYCIDGALKNVYSILLLIAIVSIIGLLVGINPKKSMIVFSEPSHFALVYLPITIFFLAKQKRTRSKLKYLLPMLGIGIMMSNLTIMLCLCFSLFITFRGNIIKAIFNSLIVASLLLFVIYTSGSSYFIDRLIFTGDISNISVLVFLSGIERIYLNLVNTSGLGVGFQQMGYLDSVGSYQAVLERLGVGTLNLFDGSFILSKLIVELGIYGIALFVLYIYILFGLNKMYRKGCFTTSSDLFLYSCYVSFFIPLLVRGSGYFNTNTLLLFCTIPWILKLKYRSIHRVIPLSIPSKRESN